MTGHAFPSAAVPRHAGASLRRAILLVGLAAGIGASCSPAAEPGAPAQGVTRHPQDVCPEGGDRTATVGVAERDSAGIRIVENWVDPRQEVVHRPEVVAAISPESMDEAGLSRRLAGALRFDDGQVLVADSLTSSLALFESTGRLVRLVGRAGRGPGEYERIQRVVRLGGDTIAVFDLQWARRMTRILRDGRFVDARILPDQPREAGSSDAWAVRPHLRFPVGFLRDGALLSYIRLGFQSEPPGPGRAANDYDTLEVQRLDLTTGRAVALLRVPHWTLYTYEDQGGAMWQWLAPFSPRATLAPLEAGFYLGNGERYELTEYTPSGAPLRLLRVCLGPRRVNEGLLRRWRDYFISRASESDRALTRKAVRAAGAPATGPAYGEVLVGRDGWIWIGDPEVPGASQAWRGLDPVGRAMFRVELPPRVRLVEAGGEHLLGIQTDEEDLQRVLVFALAR